MPMMLDFRSGHLERIPSLLVSSATIEDARRLVDIEFLAFENERTNQVLSYRDYAKPSHFERTVAIYTAAMASHQTSHSSTGLMVRSRAASKLENELSDSGTRFLKITDSESAQAISFAKTENKTYSVEELHSPADVGHEDEEKMNRDWFALNEKCKREYIGLAPHCYIGMLATRPSCQKNGAGTMLMNHILGEADEAGIEVYLEATDTAKPLYEKHGFQAVTEIRFDPARYGVRGLAVERQTVMVRGALGANGQRKAVRDWETAVSQAAYLFDGA